MTKQPSKFSVRRCDYPNGPRGIILETRGAPGAYSMRDPDAIALRDWLNAEFPVEPSARPSFSEAVRLARRPYTAQEEIEVMQELNALNRPAVHRDAKTGARVDNPPEPPDPDPLF